MRWAAKNRCVISYHQCETVEMNFPYHRAERAISEAIPLGLASEPSSPSDHASPTCYSPVPSVQAGPSTVLRRVQSQVVRSIPSDDSDFETD